MSSSNKPSIRRYTLFRAVNKLLQYVARSFPCIPAGLRSYIHRLRGVKFADVNSVFIGKDVYLDDIFPEKIMIGRHVCITEGTRILTHYLDVEAIATVDRPFRYKSGSVVIGDFVFIGMNTVIAKPVRIGEGSVVGANSVIAEDVPPYAVVGGVPARVIGKRETIKHT